MYGSDYPVPALGGRIIGMKRQPAALFHGGALTPQLVSVGLLTAAEAASLQEVFDYNPLLCDLMIKLTVRHPITGAQFPPTLFGQHPLLPPGGQPMQATVAAQAQHAPIAGRSGVD